MIACRALMARGTCNTRYTFRYHCVQGTTLQAACNLLTSTCAALVRRRSSGRPLDSTPSRACIAEWSGCVANVTRLQQPQGEITKKVRFSKHMSITHCHRMPHMETFTNRGAMQTHKCRAHYRYLFDWPLDVL